MQINNKQRNTFRFQNRLRIYGNYLLIEDMNHIISQHTGLPLKSIQKTTNNITKALYYQSKSILPIIDWIYNNATLYNPNIKNSFE